MLPILNSAEQNYAIFSHILKIIQGFVFNLKKNMWRLNFLTYFIAVGLYYLDMRIFEAEVP